MRRGKQEKRPSSDNFADVHIFVVPHELWMEKYRTAYNNSTLESISAGFVRVAPGLNMVDLRNQIREQLGGDVIPEDYVFLRCVGRCLAIVSKAQEFSLKVKHFLPPVVSSPEIFVLFGTHESLSHSLASSLNTAASDLPEYVSGYLTYSRDMDDDDSRCSSRSTGDASPESRTSKYDDASVKEGDYFSNTGHLQRRVHFETNSANNTTDPGHNNDGVDDDFKIEATAKRNEDDVSLRKDNEQNDKNATATYLTEQPSTEQPSNRNLSKSKQNRQSFSQTPQNTATHNSRNENLQEFPTEKKVAVRSAHQQNGSTLATPKMYVEDKHRMSLDGDRNNLVNPRNKPQRKNPLIHSKTAPSLLQDSHQDLPNKKNSEKDDKVDLNEVENEAGKAETSNEDYERSRLDGNEKKNEHVRNILTEKDEDTSEKNNINKYSNDPKSTNAVSSSVASDALRSLVVSDRTANKQDIQHKDTDLGQTIADKENIVLQLQAELNAVRSERSNSEKTREQLVKKAKNLQNQNNQKRSQARNIWKKRYFEEKKKTVSLEERCNQLRYEVDVLHKRLLSSVDSKDYEATQGYVHHAGDPDKKVNNKILLLTRKENEVEELKRRVEEAKIKLGSEMKIMEGELDRKLTKPETMFAQLAMLRDTAQKELKQVRDEVIDKKINATLVKKSLSLLETRPSNHSSHT